MSAFDPDTWKPFCDGGKMDTREDGINHSVSIGICVPAGRFTLRIIGNRAGTCRSKFGRHLPFLTVRDRGRKTMSSQRQFAGDDLYKFFFSGESDISL